MPTKSVGWFVVDDFAHSRENRPKTRWAGVDNETLLQEISGYCRRVGMAESTFGRLAVNDGKLVSRLQIGRAHV